MKKPLFAMIVGAALGMTTGSSLANNVSSDVPLVLTISDVCSIDVDGINGNMQAYLVDRAINGGDNLSLGQLAITCIAETLYSWGVSGGSYMTATGGTARMSQGSHFISYTVETTAIAGENAVGDNGLATIDPAYTESNTANAVVSDTGTGSVQLTAIYINPVENTPPLGTYHDTVHFTVAWP